MSDAFNLQAELARLDRDREETRKFVAEQHKLMRTEARLRADQAEKFRAEEMKPWSARSLALGRDRRLAPWIVGISLAASIVGGLIARHL